jgi:hypothetical protein
MNNYQIDKALKANTITRNFYEGCLIPSDLKTFKFQKRRGFFILNLCEPDHTTSGCHWISIYLISDLLRKGGEKRSIFIFDPSGQPSFIFSYQIRNWIAKNNFQINGWNQQNLQHISSENCGQFCMVASYFHCLGYLPTKILCVMSRSNLKTNDYISSFLYRKYFH